MDRIWDLIVVGAGSSGATFAVRCAEQGQRVLLLEAGEDFRSAALPEAWRSPNPVKALRDPSMLDSFLWADLNATRTSAQAPSLYWRGRGVGGSSTVNGQIAIRPPLDDFDDWVRGGCAGWSWSEVLPYFCKLETDNDFPQAPYHGSGGPTPVYRAPSSSWGSVDTALKNAGLAADFEWAEDVNAPGATGVSPYPINSRESRRVSTNDAYLEDGRRLPNLEIRGRSTVDHILFEGKRAVGVRLAGGTTYLGAEIVLSAGVIASPAILMRSGIGPASELRRLGIEILVDLPVGQNLQDHPMSVVGLPLTPDASAGPDDRHTNCCIRYSSGSVAPSNDMMMVSMNQNILSMNSADIRSGAGAVGVWVNATYSRGTVRLSGTDPASQPIVEENMLSDERDLSRLRAGIRLLGDLVDRHEISEVCDGDPWRVNRELRAALDGTDDELDSFLLSTATDTQHGTSTCRMGATGDGRSVVDPDCRVIDTASLRVIDAAIFPSVPRANTNLTAIMVGELMACRLLSN